MALSLFILILSVFSCANDAAIDDFTNPAISDSAEKIVFSGSLNIEGAVPGALSKISNESEVTGRSAFPSIVTSETSDVKYYISARATGPEGISEEIKGSVDQTAKSYSIGLTIGRTYTVTASLKKTLTDGQQVTIMEDEWENVTPSRTNTSLTHDFILKPVEGGNGSIKLKMTLPTGIDCPSLSGDEIESTIQFHDDYTTATATISVDVIPAGTYNITINFYKSSRKFLLYSISQTINVFAEMETNTWQDDGSSNSPISAGKFVLTDEIIKNYQRTIFYVSEKDFTGKEIPVGQTRTGSPYAPFSALQTAIDAIKTSNSAEDYKIFIDGNVIGSADIPSSITTSNAKSITISGYTGNDTVDVIIADNGKRVLTIATTVPLVIKNLKITGGNFSVGGGIYMDFGTKLTLDSGALVGDDEQSLATGSSGGYGNKASSYGGGIYNSGGTLLLKKGSKVCRNYCFNDVSEDTNTGGGGIASERGSITIEDGAMISYNKTGGHGGGIWLMGGTNDNVLTMNGGTISYNEAQFWGGGVHVGSVDGAQGSSCPVKLNFKGGEICYNKIFSSYVTDNSEHYYTWGPNGAGVNVDHSYMEMSGSAKIHHNDSINTGGGVHVGSTGVFLMSGGEISNNTCSRTTDTDGSPISGGGLDIEKDSKVVISGSAKIPYGIDGVKGYRKNDIWLRYGDGETPSYITVGGALSSTFEIGIELNCQRGLCIARSDGTNVTDLTPYKDYFNIIKADWLLNLSGDKKKLVLDSPLYVAGQDTHPVCGVAGSSSGNGTKGNPYDSIEQAIYAINDLNNNNAQYTILIDGEIKSSQIIPADVKASYITLKGASGNTFDKINATGVSASALTIALESASKAVDIQNLTITGGNAVNGGGILIGDSAVVFLGNDLIVSGNKASGLGGGVYAPNGLNVSGNVEITENTDSASTPKPSNLYLPSGKKVNVAGALTNGSKKAKIGISTGSEPSLTDRVTFTMYYGFYNSDTAPGTYFTGDKWNVAWGSGTSSYEAALAASGGNITIEPIYEDIKISVDKTSFAKDAGTKVITFTAKGVNSEGQQVTLPIGTGEGKVSLTYSVSYHGDPVPEESGSTRYYTPGTGTNANKLTLGDNLPLGNYIVSATGNYNNRTYSAQFNVNIFEVIPHTTSEAITLIAGMSGENTIKIVDSNIDGLVNAIKTRNSTDNTFKVNLDLSDLSVERISLQTRHGIKTVTLPTSITSFSREDVAHDAGEDIEAFIISETNSKYCTVDGVVYNKNMTELILYPKNKQDDEFTIPDSVYSLGSNAFNMAKFSKLNGLSHIQHVSNQPFYNAKNLKEADFSGLQDTKFPDYCFYYVATLEKVILSDKITEIDINSFRECNKLKEVHFLSTTPPTLNRGNNRAEFYNCNSELKFYVPAGSKNNYLNSSNFTDSQYNYFAGSGLADRIIEE